MMRALIVAVLLLLSLPGAWASGCRGTGSCYWVTGTGTTTTTTKWATTSGGATTGGLPSYTDDCIFDTASSTANAAYTVTVAAMSCRSWIMAGPGGGNKVTWAGSGTLSLAGSLTLTGGTAGITRTYTGGITLSGSSGTQSITSNGVTLASSLTVNNPGATAQLADALSTTVAFVFTAGTFNTNGKTVTSGSFLTNNSNVRAVAGSSAPATSITWASAWGCSRGGSTMAMEEGPLVPPVQGRPRLPRRIEQQVSQRSTSKHRPTDAMAAEGWMATPVAPPRRVATPRVEGGRGGPILGRYRPGTGGGASCTHGQKSARGWHA